MTQEPACIVEVIEIVPPEDVPVVAARVAERLAMPVERVQKLIDARVGPITRPLRADKAEAIAQTFEAAGVVVAIRPATEDDEIFETPPTPVREAQEAAPPDPAEGEEGDPEAGVEVEGEPDVGAGDVEDEFDLDEDEPDEHESAFELDPEFDPEFDPEPEPDPEPELEAEETHLSSDAAGHHEPLSPAAVSPDDPTRTPPLPRERDEEPIDLPGDESESDPAEAPGHEAEPEPAEAPGYEEPNDLEAQGGDAHADVPPLLAVDPSLADARRDETPPAPRATQTPRMPAMLRIEPDDDDDDDGPDGDGLEARGEILPRRRSLVVEVGDGGATAPKESASSFTDDASWSVGGDDPAAWEVPRRAAGDPEATERPLSSAHDVDPILVSEYAGGEDDDFQDDDATAAVVPPEIGRAGRTRPEPSFAKPSEGMSHLDPDPDLAHLDDDEEDDDGDDDVVYDTAEPYDTWGDDEHDDDAHEDDDDAHDEAAGGSAGRSVPVAWRGLGGEAAGPARPLDANVPRRLDPEEERAEDAARRTTLRRTLMLWALVIAVALFAAAQFWANGRAAGGFDQGLHRFRDGEFAAARQVWSGLAASGDANAQFMLGYMSEVGMGQPWSARAAASWYRLASDQGHAEAQWRLGSLYDGGLGVPWSPSDARRWWASAADGGHAEAAFTLGRSVFTAARSPSDLVSAASAFERAVRLGWPDAVAYHRVLSEVSDAANESALP